MEKGLSVAREDHEEDEMPCFIAPAVLGVE